MIRVIVDTSVWSEVLRRKKNVDLKIRKNLQTLIEESRASLIGPIRQEILSGIKDEEQFNKVKESLESFDDIKIQPFDYELAAKLNNKCRRKGIQGSHIDFLICAVALNNKMEIFTTDNDFEHYKRHLKIKLYKTR